MNYLIIGASSGIGNELAQRLIQQNHQVFTAQRNPSGINNVTLDIAFDVETDTLDVSSLPDELHGLVYCPGTINLKPFHRLTANDFTNDLKINFLGAVQVIQTILPKLKAGKGSVVLFSSVAAQTGMSFHSSIAASKAAIEGLTVSLAAELAPSIRVNAIAPSLTNTQLAAKFLADDAKREASAKRHPLNKFGEPSHIASLAQYLLSNEAGFMTGQIVKVDGGLSAIR